MTRGVGVLGLWAFAAGLGLWAPALAIPGLMLPLQPLDVVAPLGLLLAFMYLRQLPPLLLPILASAVASLVLSAALNRSDPLALAWTCAFALPFVIGTSLSASDPAARRSFLAGFALGAVLSAGFFLVQIWVGSERMDFRTNYAFRLPPQYGRAFAMMPEVSTYTAHVILALGASAVAFMHPAALQSQRARAALAMLLLASTLAFTRSTGVIALGPPVLLMALVLATRASINALGFSVLALTALAAMLIAYVDTIYMERIANASAERSGSMRLASILGGLSVLTSGEVFGVGIGQNHEIAVRAFAAARAMGLSFGDLPDGVNSQIIGRVFEEGWGAVLHFATAAIPLVLALRRWRDPGAAALAVIAAGSALTAATVIGYRGIYTTWLWLAIPAGLLASGKTDRRLWR